MRHLLVSVIYIGIGCAYQATYDDVNVRQMVTADVPISTLGHIFAWPFVILYHLAWLGVWGLAVLCVLAIGWLALDDWRARRRRRARIAKRAA